MASNDLFIPNSLPYLNKSIKPIDLLILNKEKESGDLNDEVSLGVYLVADLVQKSLQND